VERHIHLLDQAIKEQEASLSADPSHPLRIHLPELVIPQWGRNNRGKATDSYLFPGSDSMSSDKRSSKKKGSGKKALESSALTITLPAVQPNEEPLYCYCNRVSFGEVSRLV